MATAKFKFCPSSIKKVATPITSLFMLTTGLPLEPGDMGYDEKMAFWAHNGIKW
jgi:hypothetical protein